MSRQDEVKAHEERWYRALGEFNVRFEWACRAALFAIESTLPSDNSIRSQYVHVAVLSQLDAGKISKVLRSILETLGRLDEKAKALLTAFDKLVDTRNRITHTPWFIGFAPEEGEPWDPDTVTALKPSRDLKNGPYKVPKLTLAEVIQATQDARTIEDGFTRLSAKRGTSG
jgi:hypothetical protein